MEGSQEALVQVGRQQQPQPKQQPRLQHTVAELSLVLVLVSGAFLEWLLELCLVQEWEESVQGQQRQQQQQQLLLLRQPSTVRSQVSEAWEESPACLALVAFQAWLQVSEECLACQPSLELGRQPQLQLQRQLQRQQHTGLEWHLAMERLLAWHLEPWHPEH